MQPHAPASAAIRVLLVDDDEDDWIIARDALDDVAPGRYALDWASTYEAGLTVLSRAEHAVGLLDYRLGERDGVMLLREARGRGCRAPLILLTGPGQPDVDEAAVHAGAADYLVKGRVDGELLDRAIRYALERRRTEERILEVTRAEVARDEAEARHAQLQDVVATISHDLQQPLAAILGRAQLLQRQMRRGMGAEAIPIDHLAEGLTQIAETAARMADQLGELLSVSRGDPAHAPQLDRQPVDLVGLARRAVEEAQQASHGQVIQLEVPAAPVIGDWDSGRLSRVLANLLSNAAKYDPNSRGITLRIGAYHDPEGRSWAAVAVQDRGIGIPADELKMIFEPFRRASNVGSAAGGSGIGLASVRQIVEQHGGEVRVESGLGEGSTFTVVLPLTTAGRRADD